MNIAYRFRIYPTEEQKILLGKTFGCCRFLYNQMLDDKIREYEKTEQQELVEDLVQIITVFSCKLQGKRANKARKLVKELIDDGGEEDDKNNSSHFQKEE